MKGTCMWREWCEVNANCVISHTTKKTIKQRVQSDAADKIRDMHMYICPLHLTIQSQSFVICLTLD